MLEHKAHKCRNQELNTRLTVEVVSSSAQQSSKQSQNMKENQVKCKDFCQQKEDYSI